jgi:hypothetical protein
MTKSLIIAKYKEDTSWADNYRQTHGIFIYNKGEDVKNGEIALPNVGRESNTYFHYIVNNYDSLADVNYFVQGNPFEHSKSVEAKLESDCSGFCYISDVVHSENLHISQANMPDTISLALVEEIFGLLKKPPVYHTTMCTGAMFAVSRKTIQKHPKDIYEKLYQLSIERHHLPWTMERLWPYIFND